MPTHVVDKVKASVNLSVLQTNECDVLSTIEKVEIGDEVTISTTSPSTDVNTTVRPDSDCGERFLDSNDCPEISVDH